MSLGTGVLKVEQEFERLRHSKEVSMATLRAGTTPTLHLATFLKKNFLSCYTLISLYITCLIIPRKYGHLQLNLHISAVHVEICHYCISLAKNFAKRTILRTLIQK